MHQQYVTLKTGWREDALQEHKEAVGVGVIRETVGENCLFLEQDRREGAIGLHRCLDVAPLYTQRCTIARDVVPDHLDATLRYREGHVGLEVHEAVTARHQIGFGRPFLDQRVLGFGQACAAARRVDRHLVGIGITPEHGDLPGRQFVRVLVDVVSRDGKQWLVVAEGIHQALARCVSGRQLLVTALPARDAAVCVAGALRTHGRQFFAAEACGLLRADLGQSQVATHAEQRRQADGDQSLVHV